MKQSPLQFRPDWKTTLFAGCLLPVLVALGFWQLQRAEEKEALAREYEARLESSPVSVDALDQPSRYQRLEARGSYINGHDFLLDNRLRDGRFGYEVVTPFALLDGSLLLVNRGWIEGDSSRRSQPDIEPVRGAVEISGYSYDPQPLPTTALSGAAEGWPVVAQWVDFEAFAAELQAPLKEYTLRLDNGSPGALRTDWARINLQPEQHIGYAVQWFAMAATLLVLWLLVSTNVRSWWSARHGDPQ